MDTARHRVLRAAIACFGAKGYAATTIADIESAAGLSPGAGGTYRHFPSKQAILEAVIDATVSVSDDEIAPLGDDIEQTAHDSLDYMNADLMRIFLRDLDEFPEHRERIIDRTISGSHRVVAERIAVGNPDIDAPAAAAVMLGALTYFRMIDVIMGPGHNGVDQDRFVTTWAAIYRSLLDPAPHDGV